MQKEQHRNFGRGALRVGVRLARKVQAEKAKFTKFHLGFELEGRVVNSFSAVDHLLAAHKAGEVVIKTDGKGKVTNLGELLAWYRKEYPRQFPSFWH